MRRSSLIACFAALVFVGASPASLVKVQITKDGLSPANVTIQAGGSVSWVNSDSHDHRLSCRTCSFHSNTLKPHDSYGFTFLHSGKFTITDTLNHNKTATVTVKPAAATVTIASAPGALAYGKSVTITGTVSSRHAGAKVEIFAQKCIASTVRVVAKVASKKDGTFSYKTRPGLVTIFHARYAAPSGTIVSSIVRVQVAPIVTLKRLSRGRYSAAVVARRPFVGKAVAFQRFLPKQGRWITSKVVVLDKQHASATPLKNSVVSSTVFTSKLRKGTRVRALLRSFQALPCYSTAWSKALTA
jgi:plastocyanin